VAIIIFTIFSHIVGKWLVINVDIKGVAPDVINTGTNGRIVDHRTWVFDIVGFVVGLNSSNVNILPPL
jgi:hypothetical protein